MQPVKSVHRASIPLADADCGLRCIRERAAALRSLRRLHVCRRACVQLRLVRRGDILCTSFRWTVGTHQRRRFQVHFRCRIGVFAATVTRNETPCAGLSDFPHQPASRSLLVRNQCAAAFPPPSLCAASIRFLTFPQVSMAS